MLQVSPRKVSNDGKKMNTADGMFCYCKRGEDEDDMVACDNKNCSTEWFHFFLSSALALNPHQRAAGSVLTADSFQNSAKDLLGCDPCVCFTSVTLTVKQI